MTTSTPQPVAGRRFAVVTLLLGSLTAFGPLSMDLYLPAFPELAADLDATQAQVQLTLTADVVGLVAGQLVLGPLSDAWGRRRLLLGSTAVCALASLLCALAPSVAALTAWRFVQGFAGGGGIVLARAVASDLTTGVAAARLFSLFMTLSSVAPIAAPVAGGALLAWTGDWRVAFHVLAVLNAGLAVAAWRSIPETLPVQRRHRGGLRQTARAFADLVRDRVFLGYALTVAFAYASLFGYISGSSFVLQEHYGLSVTQFSALFALNAAGMVVLGLVNARLVGRFAVRRLLVVGLALSTVAAAVLVLGVTAGAALGVGAVLPALFVVVTTRGLVSSNATVLGVERGARAAGSASAVLGAFMFGGGILVTPLLGIGPEGSPVPMALVVAGGALAALAATVLLTRSTADQSLTPSTRA
jgi:DHA1 family bicyclomycin/chloramphenicol resistance-like MFS transporter